MNLKWGAEGGPDLRPEPGPGPRAGQGLTLVHFSFQHKLFLWDRGYIQGVFRGCVGVIMVYQGVYFESETAQVELKSGRVSAPRAGSGSARRVGLVTHCSPRHRRAI